MSVQAALLDFGDRTRNIWNTHHRLRVGTAVMGVWVLLIPLMRLVNQHFFLIWASVGIFSIGFGLAVGVISSVVAAWRSTDWPDVTDSDNWPGGISSEPTSPPESIGDEYEYSGLQTLSLIELGGKSFSWAFLVWWLVYGALFILILSRPEAVPYHPKGTAMIGFVVAVLVGMVIVHEGLHGIVARIYGADVSFGLSPIGPYTEYSGVILSRWENVQIIAAPLLILTPLAAAASFFANGILLSVGLVVLTIHTVMSSGDLYQIGYYLYSSPGTRFHHPPDGPPHIYQDKNRTRKSLLHRLDEGIAWLGVPLTIPALSSYF